MDREVLADIERIKDELKYINRRLSNIEEQTGFKAPKEKIEEIKEEKPEIVEAVKEEKKTGLELDIGRKLFNKVGIISLVIGVAFFVKYSFELGLLGPIGKVIVGIVAGIVLFTMGEVFDRKKEYTYLARSLTGGSFAVFYITIYAAHNFYSLIPKSLDIVILGMIVALAVFFALKYNSIVIASAAFLLGYIISLMSKITEFTLIYSLALTAGLIIISRARGWSGLGMMGLIATYLIHIGFPVPSEYVTSGIFLIACLLLLIYLATGIKDPVKGAYVGIIGLLATYLTYLRFPVRLEEFTVTSAFLVAYFVFFTYLSFALKKTVEGKVNYSNIGLSLLNAAFFYGLFYSRIGRSYELYLGLFTLGVAVVYLPLAYLAIGKGLKNLFGVFLVLCITFVTITVPVQLNDELVTVFWAVEALALMVFSFKFEMKHLRVFGSIVAAITIFKTVFVDSNLHPFAISKLLESTRFFAYIVPIIAFYVISMFYRANKERIEETEKNIGELYACGATFLVTILLALELRGGYIAAAWALQALVLLASGFKYRYSLFRLMGIGLLGLTTFKVFIFDLAGLEAVYRILSFIALGIILLIASYAYGRYRHIFEE